MNEPYDYEEDDEYLEDEDEEFFDCGLMPDGGCSKAGSEECDWECPFSR